MSERVAAGNNSRPQRQKTCFRCGVAGHMHRFCMAASPQVRRVSFQADSAARRRCYRCRQAGHLQRFCTNPAVPWGRSYRTGEADVDNGVWAEIDDGGAAKSADVNPAETTVKQPLSAKATTSTSMPAKAELRGGSREPRWVREVVRASSDSEADDRGEEMAVAAEMHVSPTAAGTTRLAHSPVGKAVYCRRLSVSRERSHVKPAPTTNVEIESAGSSDSVLVSPTVGVSTSERARRVSIRQLKASTRSDSEFLHELNRRVKLKELLPEDEELERENMRQANASVFGWRSV